MKSVMECVMSYSLLVSTLSLSYPSLSLSISIQHTNSLHSPSTPFNHYFGYLPSLPSTPYALV